MRLQNLLRENGAVESLRIAGVVVVEFGEGDDSMELGNTSYTLCISLKQTEQAKGRFRQSGSKHTRSNGYSLCSPCRSQSNSLLGSGT